MLLEGYIGVYYKPQTKAKIIQNRETAKKFGQNRIQAALDDKTEKPLLFSTQNENRMLKNKKSANQNPKNEVFWHKNRKTDLKNSQNRKTENPNVPLVLIWKKEQTVQKLVRSPTTTFELKYKVYKNKLNHLMRIAKRTFYDSKLGYAKNDLITTCKLINEGINKRKNNPSPIRWQNNHRSQGHR